MLPLLQLDFSSLCQSALDFSRLDGIEGRALSDAEIERECRAYTGQSFAYRDEDLRGRADTTKQNLDQLLSRELVYGFTRHPVKRKSLLWLGRRYGCVIITVCDGRGQVNPGWLCKITGYFESGNDYVGTIDRPYAYWDGGNLHRIYPEASIRSGPRAHVCDFGNAFGWTAGETDSDDIGEVEETLTANPDAWEYSIVPESHEEVVTVNNARCLLLHSRYREVLP
jgi:hypothetical protein